MMTALEPWKRKPSDKPALREAVSGTFKLGRGAKGKIRLQKEKGPCR